ncbi:hypothetical protein [Agrococcus beijingensis]|uniref:hypothetical protein n=1 Tax=Agrococcus beijingensis TaxID=3068634 RepID=UPI0027427050|nr:hypothetical protein [Agrococcus sp. REN33]
MQTQTSTNHFQAPVVIQATQHDYIARAYRLAGLPAPDSRLEVDTLIHAEPGVDTTVRDLVAAAPDAKNPAQFLKGALDKLQRAQAADALRGAWDGAKHRHAIETMPQSVDTAAADLAPAFDSLVQQLKDAAAKLDHDRPFDAETALANDAGAALTTARTGLANLGTYLGIHEMMPPAPDAPAALSRVLGIVALPDFETERVQRSLSASDVTILNPRESEGARTARTLATALERDQDYALLAIARGDYPGVTLKLAGATELRARRHLATRAQQRVTAD